MRPGPNNTYNHGSSPLFTNGAPLKLVSIFHHTDTGFYTVFAKCAKTGRSASQDYFTKPTAEQIKQDLTTGFEWD